MVSLFLGIPLCKGLRDKTELSDAACDEFEVGQILLPRIWGIVQNLFELSALLCRSFEGDDKV